MKFLKSFLISLLLCFLASSSYAGLVIDNFEQYPIDKFPSSWRTWPFQRSKAMEEYKVGSENGNKFLRAHDPSALSIQVLKNFHWDIASYPKLSWRWRANILPVGANETNPATNDSACGVYVVISKARAEMIKYTWSTTAPVGTTYEKKPGKAYIIVADSGKAKLGTWLSHTVNVMQEYKKYFHKGLSKDPVAIAVLTDGNATNSPAACDYDDFTLE